MQQIIQFLKPRLVNVRDMGAVGDGRTDDTAALQKALTIVGSAGGGVVFIPKGRYVTTKNLTILSHTIVQGAGWGQTILAPKPSSEVPRPLLVGRNRPPYGPSNHVIIRDLQVDGGDPKVPRQGIAILGGSSHVTIERCRLCNLGEYGIVAGDIREAEPYAGGLHGIIIRNNHVDMTGAMLTQKEDGTVTCAPIGIEVFPKGSSPYHAAPGVLIEGNTVIAGAHDGMICGIKVSNQSGARILNNHVSAPIESGEDRSGAITVTTSRDTVVSGNAIHGGKLGIGLTGAVANVPNGAPSENIQVVANSIQGVAQYGIYSSGGFSGLLIQGNSITVVGDGTQGVRLELFPALAGFNNLSFVHNRLHGGGIDILPAGGDGWGAPGARVIGNQFEGIPLDRLKDDPGAFGPCNNPIDISGSDILLEGNRIEGCVAFGIRLVGDRSCMRGNVVIDGNMRNDANQCGIHLQGKGAEITGNIFINNPGRGHLKHGLFLANTGDVKCAGNVFCGMEHGAVWPLPGDKRPGRPKNRLARRLGPASL